MARDTGKRLLLVDSHSLIYRAFFALPALTDRKGRLTNAAFGFTSMLLNALAPVPDFVVAAFDLPGRTFRHDEFPDYKAHRPETPSDLSGQFPIVREVVAALNMTVYQQAGFEADDIIGTLATRASGLGLKTTILTGDLDPLQLVDENTTVLIMRRGISEATRYGVEEVRARYGLEPAQMIDFKALKGDTSDNIPGVPGIGDKTATKLLQEHGTLEHLLDHLTSLPAGRVRTALEADPARVLMSKRLATIRRDVPVELDLESSGLRGYDVAAVTRLFEEYDFRSLLPRLPKTGARALGADDQSGPPPSPSAAPQSETATLASTGAPTPSPTPPHPGTGAQGEFSFIAPTAAEPLGDLEVETEIVTGGARLSDVLGRFAAHPVSIALALEDPQPRHSQVAGIALCAAAGSADGAADRAIYVPLREGGAPIDTADEVLSVLRDAWPSLELTAQSLKQVELALGPRGFSPPSGFDVSLAAYLCDSRAKTPPVAEMAYQWLGLKLPAPTDLLGSGRKAVRAGDIDAASAGRYYGREALAVGLLRNRLEPELEAQAVGNLYREVEVPLAPVLAEMELAGIGLDVPLLLQLSEELGSQVANLEDQVCSVAGYALNINSPLQLQKFLFDELNLKHGRRTRTGAVSTDSTVLESLRDEHPVVGQVLEYRQLTKLKSTYIDALPALVDPVDHRIHTSYNQAVASTGRLSSSDPNLQNIPVRTGLGRRIRRAFIPEAGNVLLSADYSQIELRVLAHVCGDPALTQAFAEDQDIHSVTASVVFGVALEDVTSDQRRAAKVANFGVLYGLSEFGLQRDLGLPQEQARDFIKNYFARFGTVKGYLEGIKRGAYETGYVETILGRRRYLQDLRAANPVLRSAAERMAINMPIQGSAADIMKLAMIGMRNAIRDRGMRSRMVLQVHDELVFDVLPAELDALAAVVRDEMGSAYALSVPLGVDLKVGPNWDEMAPLAVA